MRLFRRLFRNKFMNNKYEVKLTKVSTHSYYVVIPKETVKKYGWREKQKMTIVDKGRGLLEVRDHKSK